MDSDEFSSISSSSFPSSYASRIRRSASDPSPPLWKTIAFYFTLLVSIGVVGYFLVWQLILGRGNTRLLHYLEEHLKSNNNTLYKQYLNTNSEKPKDIPGKPTADKKDESKKDSQ